MRLFTAIRLDPGIQNALTDAQEALRSGGYYGHFTDTQNLHLTLAFIGEYSDPDRVLNAVRQVQFTPFTLRTGGNIGNFDNLLWAGMEENPELSKLVEQHRSILAAEQIPFDTLPFNPHITLLRKARIGYENSFRFSEVKVAQAEMTVTHISLMRSDFVNRRAVYTEING